VVAFISVIQGVTEISPQSLVQSA